jgi:hypothetical protein
MSKDPCRQQHVLGSVCRSIRDGGRLNAYLESRSDSIDASFEGEPVSREAVQSVYVSVGLLVPQEPGGVTAGGESSPEWNGLPTHVRNCWTSDWSCVVGDHT